LNVQSIIVHQNGDMADASDRRDGCPKVMSNPPCPEAASRPAAAVRAVEPPETVRTEEIEGRLTRDLRPRPIVPRWAGWLMIAAAGLMLPWVAGLALVLPTRHEAAHYDASWIGFDIALCAMLLRTGWLGQKGREHIELSAAITGTLLLVDAWFDVVTADSRHEFAVALILAVFAEIPLAVFCLWIAGRVEFRRQRRARATAWLLRSRHTGQVEEDHSGP
jgi:hypothetical protein